MKRGIVVLLVVLTTGCNSLSAPDAQLDVTINAGTPSFSVRVDTTDWPEAECVVPLTAAISGSGQATWDQAKFRWYLGLDRTAPVDSAVISADEVKESWNGADLAAGELQGGWRVWANLPFDLEIEFSYRMSGASRPKTASVRITCGPAVPASAPAPPTLTNAAVEMPPGTPEPGDQIVMRWRSAGARGVWATQVLVFGAFDLDTAFSEGLGGAVDRDMRMWLPNTSRLGVPGEVAIFAIDPFGQWSVSELSFPALADMTPPGLFVQQMDDRFRPTGALLGGRYFEGETMTFLMAASDNHKLTAMSWSAAPGAHGATIVSPFRDQYGVTVQIPASSDWLGGMRFRFSSYDSLGLTREILTDEGAFRVYPTRLRPTASVDLPAAVYDEVFDPDRNLLYLLAADARRITILSLATRAIVGSIDLSTRASGFDIAPGGDSLILAMYAERALGIINLRAPTPALELLPLTVLDESRSQGPVQVRVTNGPKAFLTLSGSPGFHPLIEVDLATGQQRVRTDGVPGGVAQAVERSADHSVLLVSRDGCQQRYVAATDTFGACGGPLGGAVTMDRAGTRFVRSWHVYDASFALERTVETVINTTASAVISTIDPDGQHVYHFLSYGILKSRVSDGALLERIMWSLPFGFGPRLKVSPDGNTLVLVTADHSLNPRTNVAMIDLAAPAGTIATAPSIVRASSPTRLSPVAPARSVPRARAHGWSPADGGRRPSPR